MQLEVHPIGPTRRRHLFAVLVGSLGLALALYCAAAIYEVRLVSNRSDADLEVFKFLLATCALGALLFVYQAIEALREARENEREELIRFREKFLTAYHDIKRVRRKLRFVFVSTDDGLRICDSKELVSAYDMLNTSYVEFELLRKLKLTRKGVLERQYSQVVQDMRSVDKYLRGIMIELEGLDWKSNRVIGINEVEKLQSFLFADKNPVHVAASKSLDKFLVELTQTKG